MMDESINSDTGATFQESTGSLPMTNLSEISSPSSVQPKSIKKDWGKAFPLYQDDQVRIVRIEIDKGWMCSQHYHEECDNCFHVISGALEVIEEPGDGYQRYRMLHGDSQPYVVYAKRIHRFKSHTNVVAIEIYRSLPGKKIRADDIVRLEDGCRVRTD